MKKDTTILAAVFTLSFALPAADLGWNQDNNHFKPASAHEGVVTDFRGEPAFDTQQLFPGGRFPNHSPIPLISKI